MDTCRVAISSDATFPRSLMENDLWASRVCMKVSRNILLLSSWLNRRRAFSTLAGDWNTHTQIPCVTDKWQIHVSQDSYWHLCSALAGGKLCSLLMMVFHISLLNFFHVENRMYTKDLFLPDNEDKLFQAHWKISAHLTLLQVCWRKKLKTIRDSLSLPDDVLVELTFIWPLLWQHQNIWMCVLFIPESCWDLWLTGNMSPATKQTPNNSPWITINDSQGKGNIHF